MQFNLITFGKCKDKSYQTLCEKYLSRIQKMSKFNFTELPAAKIRQKSDNVLIKQKESEMIQAKVKQPNHLICLDERGQKISTRKIAEKLSLFELKSYQNVTWVIGGSLGIAEVLKDRSQELWKLSDLTLPYELARLVFLEQFYRALTIQRNIPYHND